MSNEETQLFEKIKHMKRENELLMVIFEEVDEMVKDRYTCSSCADETAGLFYAYNEYKKWMKNGKRSEEAIDS
jgi:hypothetical protein